MKLLSFNPYAKSVSSKSITYMGKFNEFPEIHLLPQACEGRSPTVGGR
ncbi:hypothetical protein IIU_06051 [Bacillus cereus VD133]|uniref:Uncharacterized protein n=1 Tax=Bacillus cereus VD133 TaxID=1053233 RepID=A0A9W5UZW6_BACCE|nr:hypothetical protein IIU_06051 [Bacillus cereus VD133]